MSRRSLVIACCIGVSVAAGRPLRGQTFATSDPVLREIWREGMENSRVGELAQTLMDSIGPRLTGSPGHEAGNRWLVKTYAAMGVTARTESYGTWLRWRRGRTHLDLVEPRVRTLEATASAWTPGTAGRTVRGSVVTLPAFASPADFEAWLPSVAGRFVAVSAPEATCRPDGYWQQLASPEAFAELRVRRQAAQSAWSQNLVRAGFAPGNRRSLWPLHRRLEDAGAAGILTSSWPGGWGVHRVFSGGTEQVPTLALSCEDFGLVTRLAQAGQGPVLEMMADHETLGEGPVFNVIAEVSGTDLPDEYVMLSAHFDSWDGGSGATDNGTGTVTMLEAMRILRKTYPAPRRTLLVGHWSGEEQGLNGSRAFASDHPEVVAGLQALFNQDNGTFRVATLDASGFTDAGGSLARWLGQVPTEITRHIDFDVPGTPSSGGTDHAAFVCHGAPAFNLRSASGDYDPYTWHTDRDTFDKLVLPEVRNNAVLTAMLVYLASEDPERTPRTPRTAFERDPLTGAESAWPECEEARRSYDERRRQ